MNVAQKIHDHLKMFIKTKLVYLEADGEDLVLINNLGQAVMLRASNEVGPVPYWFLKNDLEEMSAPRLVKACHIITEPGLKVEGVLIEFFDGKIEAMLDKGAYHVDPQVLSKTTAISLLSNVDPMPNEVSQVLGVLGLTIENTLVIQLLQKSRELHIEIEKAKQEADDYRRQIVEIEDENKTRMKFRGAIEDTIHYLREQENG